MEEASAATATQVVCGVVPLTRGCLPPPRAAPGLADAEVLPSVAGCRCVGGGTVTPLPRGCCLGVARASGFGRWAGGGGGRAWPAPGHKARGWGGGAVVHQQVREPPHCSPGIALQQW